MNASEKQSFTTHAAVVFVKNIAAAIYYVLFCWLLGQNDRFSESCNRLKDYLALIGKVADLEM